MIPKSRSSVEAEGFDVEFVELHWHVNKLLELGVDQDYLEDSNLTLGNLEELVRSLLYVKERYGEISERHMKAYLRLLDG